MLPTLSSAIHLTVVVPSVVTLKLALAPATAVPLVTVSLPLIVGCAAVGGVDDALDAGAGVAAGESRSRRGSSCTSRPSRRRCCR